MNTIHSMRLDRFLSHQLGKSRKQVTRALKEKRVILDSKVITNGAVKLLPEQKVLFDQKLLKYPITGRYFMLNKPKGYLCATRDPHHPVVNDFFDETVSSELHAAGRLDIDATGLVLMTDDGQWSHRLTSPKYHCKKTYWVTLASPISHDPTQNFLDGLRLKNEKTLTRPAQLKIVTPQSMELTITEGRYHQVKRMFAAIGHHVTELHRMQIGSIKLDEALMPGQYRLLTKQEINSIISFERMDQRSRCL